MMTFNPTTLNFYYSGVELASKNVRCKPNLTDLISNPRYTVRIEYNQSQRDWLQKLAKLRSRQKQRAQE